jgi:hypothetical protein
LALGLVQPTEMDWSHQRLVGQLRDQWNQWRGQVSQRQELVSQLGEVSLKRAQVNQELEPENLE